MIHIFWTISHQKGHCVGQPQRSPPLSATGFFRETKELWVEHYEQPRRAALCRRHWRWWRCELFCLLCFHEIFPARRFRRRRSSIIWNWWKVVGCCSFFSGFNRNFHDFYWNKYFEHFAIIGLQFAPSKWSQSWIMILVVEPRTVFVTI